jgi:hypothetical protein
MLAGETGVLREAEFCGAGASDGETPAGKRNVLHLPIRALDEEFVWHEVIVTIIGR